MSEAQSVPGTVAVVDPDGRLGDVVDALTRGGIADVRTLDSVAAIADCPSVACVLVPDAPASDEGGPDGERLLADALERTDAPVGVYAAGADRDRVVELLVAGAGTVICVPPERDGLLANRVRHLAGVMEGESVEDRYASLLDHYPGAIYGKVRDGRFLDATAYAHDGYRDLEMNRRMAVGLTDFELFDAEAAAAFFEEEQALMARGERIENRIDRVHIDGEERFTSTTKVPRYDADGDPVGVVGDVRDVTPIKRRERMMATLHDASRRLVRATDRETVGETAVEIATEFDVLPQARIDLFDRESGELREVAASDDGWPEWHRDVGASIAETGTSHYRTATGEVVAVAADRHDHDALSLPDGVDSVSGLPIPLGDHGVFTLDAGEESLSPFTVELAHVLASNVEAALDRAEQQARLEAQADRLEEFALLGSHELRNRLQVALGTAERARAQDDIEAVDDVVETLGRMNRLVTQLLTLARTGTVSNATSNVALSGLAEEAWATVDGGAATLTVADDGIVTADRDGLLEVFETLFRTAVDGGASETVTVGTTDDGFYVADDGEAIPEDQYATLLEPTHSDVEVSEGDSVYLVAVIADAHGWTVDVDGDGGGTRFVFGNVDLKRVR